MNSLIIVAAGRGNRMGGNGNKLFLTWAGKPLIQYTLESLRTTEKTDELIIVTRREERSTFEPIVREVRFPCPVRFADGGDSRMDSVRNGMAAIATDSDKVIIHDGARPFVEGKHADEIFDQLSEIVPAVVYGLPCVDTVKEAEEGYVTATKDRSKLFLVQTPQGFMTKAYREALRRQKDGEQMTDDAAVAEAAGIPVRIQRGHYSWFKVTTAEDWERCKQMILLPCPVRIGQGYDIHAFDAGRPLILGGVRISDKNGLLGHSDGDALLHALMDALLGAAGMPDIGHCFPDTDKRYEGVCSGILLETVGVRVAERYVIGNIDAVIIAETPKMAPYIPAMKQEIAARLHIEKEQINIKASTNEGLGAIGRGEGIAALASVILQGRKSYG